MTHAPYILVVGAGASFGARSGSLRPVLGRDLTAYLSQWLASNRAFFRSEPPRPGTTDAFTHSGYPAHTENASLQYFLDVLAANPTTRTKFEKAMNELVQRHGAFAVSLVHRLLARALTHGVGCRFVEGVDHYDLLLKKLGLGTPASVVSAISFNYDLLLEEAAARILGQPSLSMAVDYGGLRQLGRVEAPAVGRLRVFKPHGSINWFDAHSSPGSQMNPDRPMGTLAPSGDSLDYGDENLTAVIEGSRDNVIAMLETSLGLVLAPYCHGKPATQALDDVRAAAMNEIKACSESCLIVIGVLAPELGDAADDPFLSSLFSTITRHPGPKLYVNPSAADCDRALAYALEPRQLPLEQFLSSDFFPA